jgi:hypothetical protein
VAVELACARLRTTCGLEHMGVRTWRERVVRPRWSHTSKEPLRVSSG